MAGLLFQYLRAINQTKRNYLLESGSAESESFSKEYNPYAIGTFLGGTLDTVLLANEANVTPKMSPERQFVFLLGTVRPRSRFTKWPKHAEADEAVLRVAEYYGVSNRRAREYLTLHTDAQLEEIFAATDHLFERSKKRGRPSA